MNNVQPLPDTLHNTTNAPELWQEEETLIADVRAELSPSQMVEQKLIHRLKESPLLLSQVQRRLKPGPR